MHILLKNATSYTISEIFYRICDAYVKCEILHKLKVYATIRFFRLRLY